MPSISLLAHGITSYFDVDNVNSVPCSSRVFYYNARATRTVLNVFCLFCKQYKDELKLDETLLTLLS